MPSIVQQRQEKVKIQINFPDSAYQKVEILVNQRSELQNYMAKNVFDRKNLLIKHSIHAEKSEYEDIYLKKI